MNQSHLRHLVDLVTVAQSVATVAVVATVAQSVVGVVGVVGVATVATVEILTQTLSPRVSWRILRTSGSSKSMSISSEVRPTYSWHR